MIDVIAYDKIINKDITFLKSIGSSKKITLNTGRFPVKFKYFNSFMLSATCPDCTIQYKVIIVDNHGGNYESLLVDSGEPAFVDFQEDKLDNYPEEIIYEVAVTSNIAAEGISVKPLQVDKPLFKLNAKFVDTDISGDISRYSYKLRSVKDNIYSDFVDVAEDSIT